MNNKFCSLKQITQIVRNLQKKGKKVVFTNGCFDLIHVGHVNLFQKAKSLGDVLIVAINSDKSLANIKGPKRPLVCQKDRVKVLSALQAIDYIIIFSQNTPYEVLKQIKPDILVKGADYKIKDIIGREFVKKVYRFPFVKGKSTTNLIKLIVERYGNKL